jgi:hypothetical protein
MPIILPAFEPPPAGVPGELDYLLEVAWRDTGSYKYLFDPYDNVTGDVMTVECLRGRDFYSAVGRWVPGQLSALLRNDSGLYSGGGPLAPYLKAGRPVVLSGGLRESSLAAKFVAADTRYLMHADAAVLSVGDIYWDMVVWVYVTTPANNQGIVFKGVDLVTGGDFEYCIYVFASRFRFAVRDVAHTTTTTLIASTFGDIPAGTLCMVHVYHDPVLNQIGISVNAGAHDTSGTAGGVRDNTGDFQVGRQVQNGTPRWLDGDVGPVAIWKPTGTNLTAAQLTWLYNTGYGRDFSEVGIDGTDGAYLVYDAAGNLIMMPWWQLDEVSGSRAAKWQTGYPLAESGGTISSEAGLDTKVYRGLWAGVIDSIQPSAPQAGALHVSTLKGIGPLAQLTAAKTLNLPMTSELTGFWIRDILFAYMTSVYFLTLDWDDGQTLTGTFYPDNAATGLELIRQMEDTEPGLLYEFLTTNVDSSRDFHTDGFLFGLTDRWHRLTSERSLVSQATFSDDPGVGISVISAEQKEPLSGIYNQIQVTVKAPDTAGALAVLWTAGIGTSLAMAARSTLRLTAKYPTAVGGGDAASYVDPWTTPVLGTDITTTPVGDVSQLTVSDVVKSANEMSFTITNASYKKLLYINLIRARGIPWTKATETLISAGDAASIATYGLRAYPLPPLWLPDIEAAQNFCDYIVSRYKDPHTRLAVAFVASKSTAQMHQALTGMVGDRVTFDLDGLSGLGINEDFYIEAIHHAISNGKTLHIATYDLVSCSGEGAYLVLDYSPLEYAAAHPTYPTSRLEY